MRSLNAFFYKKFENLRFKIVLSILDIESFRLLLWGNWRTHDWENWFYRISYSWPLCHSTTIVTTNLVCVSTWTTETKLLKIPTNKRKLADPIPQKSYFWTVWFGTRNTNWCNKFSPNNALLINLQSGKNFAWNFSFLHLYGRN